MSHRDRSIPVLPTPEDYADLAFAAGIIAGEGCVNNGSKPTVDGCREVHFSVMMQCHSSVEHVARVLAPFMPDNEVDARFVKGINVHYQYHVKGGHYARIHLTGAKAQVAVRVLWPWLKRTDKGSQALDAFDIAGLSAPTDYREV